MNILILLTTKVFKEANSHVFFIREEFHFPPRAFFIWFCYPAPAPRFGALI
jgi:hypothetical protein